MATRSVAEDDADDLMASVYGQLLRKLEFEGLCEITVEGYKSILNRQSIALKPLTILAGANSSGKSSMVQPALLLKQTLEAPYDPGALKVDGPNVRFTNAKQLLSHTRTGRTLRGFRVGFGLGSRRRIEAYYELARKSGFDTCQTDVVSKRARFCLKRGMSSGAFRAQLPPDIVKNLEDVEEKMQYSLGWRIVRDRCFLRPILKLSSPRGRAARDSERDMATRIAVSLVQDLMPQTLISDLVQRSLQGLIHVPGLRGNPERTYPVTTVSEAFPGLFHNYVASIIARWQEDHNESVLKAVNADLKSLTLSSDVTAKQVSDAQVEIHVGRLPKRMRGSKQDLVSIADVGFGVSQVLPVVIALHIARPENLVYLEQPEIHLHPRAQVAMAQVLAKATKRGVRVILETHSALLLLGLQTLVAEGKLPRDSVKLHWFTRTKTTGVTTIRSADLDDAGAFGDWPEDFGDVEMDTEKRYLDAAEARMSSK